MIKKKGMPITGTNTAMRAKPPVLSDAAHTSSDGQKLVQQPPMPFKNPTSTAQKPPAARASGGISTMEPKILSGLKRTTVGARALPPGGPVGQTKPINQSGQVNGRMGTSFPKRKGAFVSGLKAKKGAAFYGE